MRPAISLRRPAVLFFFFASCAVFCLFAMTTAKYRASAQTQKDEESIRAFSALASVLLSPRCLNCHIPGDSPLQGGCSNAAQHERETRSGWPRHSRHALHQLPPTDKLLAVARSAGKAGLASAAALYAFGMERIECCWHLPRAERSRHQRRHDFSPTDRTRQRRPFRELGLEPGSGTQRAAVVARRVRFAL